MEGFFIVALIAMVGLAIAGMVWQHNKRAGVRWKLAQAKRVAARGRTHEALRLLRRAESQAGNPGQDAGLMSALVDVKVQIGLVEARLEEERGHASREQADVEPKPKLKIVPLPGSADAGRVSPVQPGQRVGEYVLEAVIGEGGFGQVWKARHAVLDAVAAIKIPTDGAYLESLKRLGRVQHRLQSPRIVKVTGADLDADPPYVAMEYVDGPDLRHVLRERDRLEPARAVRIFEEIVLAAKAAHDAGVVHCDLKPENILIAPGDRVKVTDFELGKARVEAERPMLLSRDLASAAAASSVAGTLPYMSPEQLSGDAIDARTDIYALGIIFFEMLTGERPQPGDKPSDLVPGLAPGCDRVFERCYARLEKRFPSADELLEVVRQIPAG